MSHYTLEAQKILNDFLDTLEDKAEADQAFVAQLRTLVNNGKFTYQSAVKEVVNMLEESVPDES